MPYAEYGSRGISVGDSASQQFCLTVWDDGDFPTLGECTEMFNDSFEGADGPVSDGGNAELQALNYAASILPTVRFLNSTCDDLLFLTDINVEEIGCTGKFNVCATYSKTNNFDPNYCQISFSTGGSEQEMKVALQHIASYPCAFRQVDPCQPGAPIEPCPPGNGSAACVGCDSTIVPRPAACPPLQPAPVPDGCGGSTNICFGANPRPDTCPPIQTVPDVDPNCYNFGGLINVNGDEVQGTTVKGSGLSFNIRSCFQPFDVTCEYVQRLYYLSPGMNSNPVLDCFAPGEVLFCGASGSGDRGNLFCIDFSFRASPNWFAGPPGCGTDGCLSSIQKLGWDYVWYRVENKIDNVCGVHLKKVSSAHVERVYCYFDFNQLSLTCSSAGAF